MLFGLALSSPAQTVGLQLQTEDSYDGYTLMPVTVSEFTYLINNCGEEVHSWQSNYKAGMMAYLLDDGSLLRAGRTNNTTFSTGGAGGIGRALARRFGGLFVFLNLLRFARRFQPALFAALRRERVHGFLRLGLFVGF